MSVFHGECCVSAGVEVPMPTFTRLAPVRQAHAVAGTGNGHISYGCCIGQVPDETISSKPIAVL